VGKKVASSTQAAYFATAVTLATSATSVQPGNAVTLTPTVSAAVRRRHGQFLRQWHFHWLGNDQRATVSLTTGALAFGYHNFTAELHRRRSQRDEQHRAGQTHRVGRGDRGPLSIINSVLLSD